MKCALLNTATDTRAPGRFVHATSLEALFTLTRSKGFGGNKKGYFESMDGFWEREIGNRHDKGPGTSVRFRSMAIGASTEQRVRKSYEFLFRSPKGTSPLFRVACVGARAPVSNNNK